MEGVALVIFLSIGFFLLLMCLQKAQEKKQTRQTKAFQLERRTDENVLKTQIEFEQRLEQNSGLPDAIVWRKAFIYRHLMRKWFSTLIARHRYDDAVSKQIKNDWLSYLDLLEQESAASFLSSESSDETKHEAYGEETWQLRQQYRTIENGFAAAIGTKATEELQRVREAGHDSFDRSGSKPMAPTGFHYSPVSLNPYDEELKPN